MESACGGIVTEGASATGQCGASGSCEFLCTPPRAPSPAPLCSSPSPGSPRGGSDCNDAADDVHPGALEVCGGGDKNCNGQHKPAFLPAKKLTNSAAFKSGMTVIDLGSSILLGWSAKPATKMYLQLLEVGWDLLPEDAVKTIDAVEVNDSLSLVSLVWNPMRQKLGACFGGPAWQAKVGWLGKDGAIAGEPQLVSPGVDGCGGASYSKMAPVQVGVALRDDASNLWFFVRDQTGAEMLEPAIIGGGEAIKSAFVMHDGIDFIVVWLAKVGGFEQAFGQRITCE